MVATRGYILDPSSFQSAAVIRPLPLTLFLQFGVVDFSLQHIAIYCRMFFPKVPLSIRENTRHLVPLQNQWRHNDSSSFQNRQNRHNHLVEDDPVTITSEKAREALKALSLNGVHVSPSQIDGLCHSKSLAAIKTLMECSRSLRQEALQDLQQSTESLEPRRAISGASSKLSGSTLTTSPSAGIVFSHSQADDYSPLQEGYARNNKYYDNRQRDIPPNTLPQEEYSEGHNIPNMPPLQFEGGVAPANPFSDEYAIDIVLGPPTYDPHGQQPPSKVYDNLRTHHERHFNNSASPARNETQQQPFFRSKTEKSNTLAQYTTSTVDQQIKRKPVGSGLRTGTSLGSDLNPIEFKVERPHPVSSKAKKREVLCHLCSEVKLFQKNGEFKKHLDAVHVKKSEYFCKHKSCTYRNFRPSEWMKHHTRDHGQTCFDKGTVQPWCRGQRDTPSEYLGKPCPKCLVTSQNHQEWLSHHLGHFSENFDSPTEDEQRPVFKFTRADSQKRNRGCRSETSSSPPADDQAGDRHVKKSPRISQDLSRQDQDELQTDLLGNDTQPQYSHSFENNNYFAEEFLSPGDELEWDIHWSMMSTDFSGDNFYKI